MPKSPWINDPKKAKVKISEPEQFFGPLLLTFESGKRWFPLSPH